VLGRLPPVPAIPLGFIPAGQEEPIWAEQVGDVGQAQEMDNG